MFSEAQLLELFERFKGLGIIIAFLLPFIEAFIPILPIMVFAVVNVNAYGLIPGFLITWSGAVAGAYCVTLLVRTYGQHRFLNRLSKHPQTLRFIRRVDDKGMLPLFLLLCFPFTPSSIVNIVAGLSTIDIKKYLWAVIFGKAIMLFTLSFIGNDIYSFVKAPERSIIVVIVLVILWWIGKRIEKHFER